MTLLQTPVIDQRDARWRSLKLGFDPVSTIGDYGCLLCCASSLAKITPPELNEIMKRNGGFDSTSDCRACFATFDLARFVPSFPRLIEVSQAYRFAAAPGPLCARLVEHTRAGQPAIVEVDMYPAQDGHQMHYVLALAGFGDGALGQVVINDPWHADQSTLAPRYGNSLARAICRVIFYGG